MFFRCLICGFSIEVFETILLFIFHPKNSFLYHLTKHTKIFDLDDITNENNEDHNKK